MYVALHPYRLQFLIPAKTSRSELFHRDVWFIRLQDEEGKIGVGECPPLPGLSKELVPDYPEVLARLVADMNANPGWQPEDFIAYPSFRFGLETALASLKANNGPVLFPSDFTEGRSSYRINGLIWMGTYARMKSQIAAKLEEGFRCLKLKIGSINWDDELNLLRQIRKDFSPSQLELRVDANGAFDPYEAEQKLRDLEAFHIHSIEQPIYPGQRYMMEELCRKEIIPIALDEELLQVRTLEEKRSLLDEVHPHYLILKPGINGGFASSEEWIQLGRERTIPFWITSSLESNVGLSALAQFTALHADDMPQGLGTGQLYGNNFPGPLILQGERLYFDKNRTWDIRSIFEHEH